MPEQKEDSENPANNLSNSLMKLAKKESHSMSDDGDVDLLDQSPLLTRTNDEFIHSSAISPDPRSVDPQDANPKQI